MFRPVRRIAMASKDIASYFSKPAAAATASSSSSASKTNGVKRPAGSSLPEAMRKAIAEGAEEGASSTKRAKVGTSGLSSWKQHSSGSGTKSGQNQQSSGHHLAS